MAITYARFLTPVLNVDINKLKYFTQDFALQPAELDEETTKYLQEEICKYEIFVKNYYSYEYDGDDTPSRGVNHKKIRLDKLISMSSSTCSSDEPTGDIIVRNGKFIGVVMYLENTGGNGWNNYNKGWYCILYEDGRISGENRCCYAFYGENSSKENEYVYYLQRIQEKK